MHEIYDFTNMFAIPHHNLSYLAISTYQFDFRYQDLCLMTTDCPNPRYYSFSTWEARKDFSGLCNWGLPQRYSDMDLKKIMVVTCGSVERLEIYGRDVYLVSDREKLKSV
ncbi:hypothetical protein K501DRAFT_334353 [Backusella circina FSU 941]|nr:hypothetical protein K501DRAFT_334353 [Backusella circina FSU 941]